MMIASLDRYLMAMGKEGSLCFAAWRERLVDVLIAKVSVVEMRLTSAFASWYPGPGGSYRFQNEEEEVVPRARFRLDQLLESGGVRIVYLIASPCCTNMLKVHVRTCSCFGHARLVNATVEAQKDKERYNTR
jgi:hypothetical protein